MQLRYAKVTGAALWILAAGTIGVVADVRSIVALVLVVIVGLVPPVLVLLLWRDSPQTLSESIQEARR